MPEAFDDRKKRQKKSPVTWDTNAKHNHSYPQGRNAMTDFDKGFDRRQVLRGAGAVAGTAALSSLPFGGAMAANYPDGNINVVVPTRAGGGADRLLRGVSGIWKKYLKTNFEPGFFPGASGRVGYEVYMGKRKTDAYNLLFGNMGPELLNWVVKKPSFDLEDYLYFGRVDTDPGVLFVGAKSKLQSLDDVIREGKKRTLNVGTSRLAHPASIGALLFAQQTGISINLIPLSGGKKTIAGVVTGEMDLSTLTSGSVAARGKSVKSLLVFNDKNVIPGRLDNAPTMNEKYGTRIPPLLSARAFAIQTKATKDHPERYKVLQDSFRQVFDDPGFKNAILKARGVWEYINWGGPDECAKYAADIAKVGAQFKPLLTGKKG
jgi:putative tricarboxylic transport membrane protein